MTFVSSFKIQAGLPYRYRLGLVVMIVSVPMSLSWFAWQTRLDWLWVGAACMLAIIGLYRLSYFQLQQRQYILQWDQHSASYFLLQTEEHSDRVDPLRFSVIKTIFTRQHSKLIFARLTRYSGRQDSLVFHAACNPINDFRSFKVRIKWGLNNN